MAQQYVIADQMFPTEFGPSFTAHQNLIAGSTEVNPGRSVINLPTLDGKQQRGDCDAAKGTTTDLDKHHAPGPSPRRAAAMLHVPVDGGHARRRAGFVEVLLGILAAGKLDCGTLSARSRKFATGRTGTGTSPRSRFRFSDVPKGNLPAVSWVIPTPKDSDHPGVGLRPRTVLGGDGRQRDRPELASGSRRRSSSCGTTGAGGTTTSVRRSSTIAAWAFAFRA